VDAGLVWLQPALIVLRAATSRTCTSVYLLAELVRLNVAGAIEVKCFKHLFLNRCIE